MTTLSKEAAIKIAREFERMARAMRRGTSIEDLMKMLANVYLRMGVDEYGARASTMRSLDLIVAEMRPSAPVVHLRAIKGKKK